VTGARDFATKPRSKRDGHRAHVEAHNRAIATGGLPDGELPGRFAYLHPARNRHAEAVGLHGRGLFDPENAPAQLLGPEERAEAERTFNVLNASRRPGTLLAAQGAALRRPGRYLRALRLALTTGRPGLKGLVWQVFYFVEASVLARHLLQNRIDHLHNHFADSSANVAMIAAALADIDFSYTLHGPAEIYDPVGWHFAEKTARARFVFCISHFARSQAMLFSDPNTGRS
jgi:hypothetical protein